MLATALQAAARSVATCGPCWTAAAATSASVEAAEVQDPPVETSEVLEDAGVTTLDDAGVTVLDEVGVDSLDGTAAVTQDEVELVGVGPGVIPANLTRRPPALLMEVEEEEGESAELGSHKFGRER